MHQASVERREDTAHAHRVTAPPETAGVQAPGTVPAALAAVQVQRYPVPLSPATILALQRTVGNAAVNQILRRNAALVGTARPDAPGPGVDAHADAPGMAASDLPAAAQRVPGPVDGVAVPPPATAGMPALQRAIGFEFEADAWHSARLNRPLTPQQRAQEPVNRVIPNTDYTPMHKAAKIAIGAGFELQADEIQIGGLGAASDIEFVTDPFPESKEGLAQLRSSLDGVVELGRRIEKLPKRSLLGAFVWPDELRAAGIPTVASDIMLRMGDQPMKVKMQSTVGLRLDQVAAFIAEIAAPQPNEPAALTRRRRAGRELFGRRQEGLPTAMTPSQVDLSPVPAAAAQAIGALVTRHNVAPGAPDYVAGIAAALAQPAGLQGLLSLIAGYVKGANKPISYPKAAAAIMARTNCAQLFSELPTAQKVLFRENPALWHEVVVDTIAPAALNRPLFLQNNPFRQNFMPHLTIQVWIDGLLRGIDELTAAQAIRNAEAAAGPMPRTQAGQQTYDTRMNEADFIESLGSYGKKMDTTASGARAAILELRAIPNMLEIGQIKDISVKLAKFIDGLNRFQDAHYGR